MVSGTVRFEKQSTIPNGALADVRSKFYLFLAATTPTQRMLTGFLSSNLVKNLYA